MVEQLNEQELQRCRKAFGEYETEGNNCIHFNYLPDALRLSGQNPKESEIDAIKNHYMDVEGQVEFVKFVSMYQELKKDDPEGNLREAFQQFDVDRNGYISMDDMRRILTELGDEQLTDEELENFMYESNITTRDGQIDYNEMIDEWCKLRLEDTDYIDTQMYQ